MHDDDAHARLDRHRQLPRGAPALWLIALGLWLTLAPRPALAEPLPYLLTLAALLLTRWAVDEMRPAGLCFLGLWLAGGALAWRFAAGGLGAALIALAAGSALLLTARWNRPPWPSPARRRLAHHDRGRGGGFVLPLCPQRLARPQRCASPSTPVAARGRAAPAPSNTPFRSCAPSSARTKSTASRSISESRRRLICCPARRSRNSACCAAHAFGRMRVSPRRSTAKERRSPSCPRIRCR